MTSALLFCLPLSAKVTEVCANFFQHSHFLRRQSLSSGSDSISMSSGLYARASRVQLAGTYFTLSPSSAFVTCIFDLYYVRKRESFGTFSDLDRHTPTTRLVACPRAIFRPRQRQPKTYTLKRHSAKEHHSPCLNSTSSIAHSQSKQPSCPSCLPQRGILLCPTVVPQSTRLQQREDSQVGTKRRRKCLSTCRTTLKRKWGDGSAAH